jgi:hypothetical protein
MPFGGLTNTSRPTGELSPKKPSFWGRQRYFLHKRFRAYLGTGETTLDSSKCASWQDTLCAVVITKGWVIAGVILAKVCFKGKFPAKFQSTAENVE